MPCHLHRVRAVGTEHHPRVILGQREMHVVKAKYLTSCHYCKRKAKAVQLATCKAKLLVLILDID
jgi:hypothetical protein